MNLLENLRRDLHLARRQRELREESVGLADRHARDLIDVLAADRDGERLRLQARAVTRLAGNLGHVVLVRLAHLVAVRLVVAAREQRHDPLERHEVLLVLTEHVRVAEGETLLARAVEQDLLRLLVDFLPRRLEAVAAVFEDGLHHAHRVRVQILRERRKDTAAHTQGRVRQDELLVELHVAAEAHADGAGAVGVVEREHARRDFGQADAAVDAGEILAEHQELAVDDLHVGDALAEFQRRLEGVGQARFHALAHDEAVDDDLDRMLLVLLELDVLADVHDLAVDAHAYITFVTDVCEDLLVFALLAAHDLRHDEQLRALRQLADLVDHLVDRLLRDGLAALRAVRMAGARKQQAQVVVDLRDRADRRARVVARRLLVNRDGRREAVDLVDVRLVHLAEELARVRRERLNVAALAFCVDRIEGQRRLARAREACDDDELVARDVDIDVLEVVRTRTLDADVFFHDCFPFLSNMLRPCCGSSRGRRSH